MGKQEEIDYPLKIGKLGREYNLIKPFGSEFPQLCYSLSILMSYLRDFPLKGSILDVGAGAGWTTEWIKKCGYENVIWMDISRHYTGVVAERLGKRAGCIVGDMEYIPLDENSVGCVFCFDALHHTDDPQKALNEFHRVTRKTLLLNEPSGDHSLHAKSKNNVKEYGVTEKGFTLKEVHVMLRNAGFLNIRVWPADIPPTYPSKRGWLNANLKGVSLRDILYNTPLIYLKRLSQKGLIVIAEKKN